MQSGPAAPYCYEIWKVYQAAQEMEQHMTTFELLADQRGWAVTAVYCDRTSGRKESHPQLNRLMTDDLFR